MVAALAAEGTSHMQGIEIISRGYEHFLDKLHGLGASIEYSGNA